MTQARFQTHPHMRRRWKQVGRSLAFDAQDAPALRAWRRKLRRKLRELTGYNTMQRAPLRPKITEEIEFDEYVR
jgi:hypothetical protein